MQRVFGLVVGLFTACQSYAVVANDCTAAFCPSQQATILSVPAAVAVPQQTIAVQSAAVGTVAVPSVLVQRNAHVVATQRVVTLRRAPVRNFLFRQRSVVRTRAVCR